MSRFDEAKVVMQRKLLDPALELIQAANEAVAAAERRAVQAEATLEALRPVWAQGWTDDGVAAQASANALSELWLLLEERDQTAAVARLRVLLDAENKLAAIEAADEFPASVWAQRAAGTWHPEDEA